MEQVSSPDQVASSAVELTKDLSGDVLATGLLVVHDTGRGGEDDVSERTGGEEEVDPGLDLRELLDSERDPVSLRFGKRTRREGRRTWMLKRGEMTPHLLMRPLS